MKLVSALGFILFFGVLPSSIFAQNFDYKNKSLPCFNKKISIVAHVTQDVNGATGISQQSVLNAVDSMNVYYSPLCISFEVCEFDTIANWQFNRIDSLAEWEDMLVKYHHKNRVNLFVVGQVLIPNPFVCGFTTPSGIQDLESGGISINKVCLVGKRLSHEMGHYFGLLDTFEGNGNELVDGSNCATTGDLICDTPADPYEYGDLISDYLDFSVNNACRFISLKQDANGDYYNADVGNVMSHYIVSCICSFSYQQYLKMGEVYREALEKMW